MAPPLPERPHLLFAGGGSGGHIAPGLAIIEALGDAAESSFICSERPVDAHMLTEAGVSFRPVAAVGLSRRPLGVVRFVRSFRRAAAQVETHLREGEIDLVATLGGFVAAPAVKAALRMNIPVVLINLDAVPGAANRWIARRRGVRVISAVPTPRRPGFAEVITGMPIRRASIADGDAARCRRAFDLDPDRPTLLVTGASQGARSINQLLTRLATHESKMFEGWQVLHLCGEGAGVDLAAAYTAGGVHASVRPFVDRMGDAWGAADLAVSRAGASSVAEAIANHVPTLFLPYPHHRDEHQRLNVQPYVEAGVAEVIRDAIDPEANARTVGPRLVRWMRDDEARAAWRQTLAARPPEAASERIATLLLDTAAAGSHTV